MDNSHQTSMPISTLLLMAGLHFMSMYVLMYSMVAGTPDIFLNLNNFYMAAIMTAPMLLIEGFLMRHMYASRKALTFIMGSSALVLVTFFLFIRYQTGIGDREFLRSMIPHHSGAILMCEQANLQNQEVRELCDSIVESQEAEIKEMKSLLERI